jgi:hypothetical protein
MIESLFDFFMGRYFLCMNCSSHKVELSKNYCISCKKNAQAENHYLDRYSNALKFLDATNQEKEMLIRTYLILSEE